MSQQRAIPAAGHSFGSRARATVAPPAGRAPWHDHSSRERMPYYLLLYEVVDDYIDRRAPLREAHLQLARAAHQRGELVLGGAFGDPVEGAALVFRAADASVAEQFAAHLPPEYYAAESAFRAPARHGKAQGARAEMLPRMPHHERTDHLRAELRARMGDVAVQAVALVLDQHHDLEVARVDQVRQHEVHQAVGAPEGHGGLRPIGPKRGQALPFAAGENHAQRVHRLTPPCLSASWFSPPRYLHGGRRLSTTAWHPAPAQR